MALCVHYIDSGSNSFCWLWRNKEVFLKEEFLLVCIKGYETGILKLEALLQSKAAADPYREKPIQKQVSWLF